MKNLITALILLSLVLFSSSALAANSNADQGNQSSQSQNQTQTENQERTNNPETGAMTETQTQTQAENSFSAASATGKQHMSQVAQSVQNLLNLSNQLGDQNLGKQIRTIAQEQNQGEEKAIQAMEQAQTKSGLAKFFIGPDYKQLKTVKQEMEQNQVRIQQLQQIVAQISNTGEQTQLQEQIQILKQQNTALQNQLNQQIQGFSLFGWLSKLINQY